MRDVAQLTTRYVEGGEERTWGYGWGVLNGLRGRQAEGGGGENAACMPAAAASVASAASAPARPAAMSLLLATSLATMDEGAGMAWGLPREAGWLRGSGGERGRRCEAERLAEKRLLASRV